MANILCCKMLLIFERTEKPWDCRTVMAGNRERNAFVPSFLRATNIVKIYCQCLSGTSETNQGAIGKPGI